MDDEQKTYWTDDPELVEKYALGKLSDEERKRFEAEIAECEPCKEKLRRELQRAAGIRRFGRDQLKTRLRLRLRSQQLLYSNRYQFIGVAAVIVIIALGIGVYQLWFSDIDDLQHFNRREVTIAQLDTTSNNSIMQNGKPVEEEERMQDRSFQQAESTFVGAVSEEVQPSSSQGNGIRTEEVALQTKRRKPQRTSGVEFTERAVVFPMKSIWLVGKVVLIAERKPPTATDVQPQTLMMEQQQALSKREQRIKSFTIVREGSEQHVLLEQRLFRELPPSRQTQIGKTQLVETFVRQDSTGLRLIIYSDTFSSTELDNTVVEIKAKDSLILATPSRRIYYKLPDTFRPQPRFR